MRKSIGIFLCLFVFENAAAIQYSQSQTIDITDRQIQTDATWGPNQTIVIREDVTVEAGATLTIESGCTIQFSSRWADLIINGVLRVQGGENAPVLFQANNDSGDWGGILLQNPDAAQQSVIQHAIFDAGGSDYFSSSLKGMVRIVNCSPKIENCTFRNGPHYGVLLENSDAEIANCNFGNHANDPMLMDVDSSPSLVNNTAAGNRFDGVRISGGTMQKDRIWRYHALPYLVDSDVTVAQGMQLQIEAGTQIQFDGQDADLIINGVLRIEGNEGNPVRLLSVDDSIFWGGVLIQNADEAQPSVIQHAIFERGGSDYFSSSLKGMLRVVNCSPTIENCIFRSSHYFGILLENSDAAVSDCEFISNTYDPIRMNVDCSPVLTNNSASENRYDGIRIEGGTLQKDRIWRFNSLPFLLDEDVTVPVEYGLVIEAGATVQFRDRQVDLICSGLLTANGSSDRPITFTSMNDSPDASWGGLLLANASSSASTLMHCMFRYGGSNYFSSTGTSMARCQDSSPIFSDCRFEFSRSYGLSLISSDADLTSIQFTNNSRAAGIMDVNSYPTLASISADNNEYDALIISEGKLSRSGRWDYMEIPYLIEGDVEVPEGVTLTIDPDSEIQFLKNSTDLVVKGSLLAEGGEAQPIRFTSVNRQEAAGAWGGIAFLGAGSSASVMRHCHVSYGGSSYFSAAYDANIRIENAFPTITNCRISQSAHDGVGLFGSTSIIERNLIENCQDHAIRMDVLSFPLFDQNQAQGCQYNNITIRGGTLASAGRWDLADLDYNLEADVTVAESIHLIIDAGNVIRFQERSTDLIVQGSLRAVGSASSLITFTSLNSAEAGSFGGLYLTETADDAQTQLSYCLFENGASDYFSASGDAVLLMDGCNPTVTYCTFQNNFKNGLHVKNGSPNIKNCSFQNNRNNAMVVQNNSFPGLENLSAAGNGSNAVLIRSGEWTGAGVWTPPSIPYEISEDVVLTAESDITLSPGNTIVFTRQAADLIVRGRFHCAGTESAPIRLTSGKFIPAKGDWGALAFESGASGSIAFLSVKYGGSNYFSAGSGAQLAFRDAESFSLNHVDLQESAYHGMLVQSSDIQLDQCSFMNNGSNGIYFNSDAIASIANCLFDGNSTGVHARDDAQVEIRDSAFLQHENALTTGEGSARIRFGNNQFTDNAQIGKVNFLTAASTESGNIAINCGPLEISGGELNSAGIMHPFEGSYYQTNQLLTIGAEGSLQIRPGTMLAFNAWNAGLNISGILGVAGLSDQPVIFSAPPAVENPEARSLFNGLQFLDQAQGAIRHAVFRNGGRSSAVLDVQGAAQAAVDQCRFEFNGMAMRVRDAGRLYVAYSRCRANATAFWADSNAVVQPSIQFSRIAGNDAGVRNDSPTVAVDATFNWWGDAGGPSGEGPGEGDSVTANVLYEPWFTQEEQLPDEELEAEDASIGDAITKSISLYGLHLYRIAMEEDKNLLCQLTANNPDSRFQLFAAYDYEPSAARYEYMTNGPQLRPQHELLIPDTKAGDYYVLVFARELSTGEETYEMQFSLVDQYVTSLTPNQAGNKGTVTLALMGSDFDDSTLVRLTSPAGAVITSRQNYRPEGDDAFYAEFDLLGASPGLYQLSVQWPNDNVQFDFPAAFEVQPGVGAKLVTELFLPNLVRPNRDYTALLHYRNDGDADLSAPIFVVTSNPAVPMSLSDSESFMTKPVQILGAPDQGPAGVLPPGGENTIPILFKAATLNPITFSIGVLSDFDELVAWNHPDFAAYNSAIGGSWGDYQRALLDQAVVLWENGIREYNASRLIEAVLNVLLDQPTGAVQGRVVDEQNHLPQTQRTVILTQQTGAAENPLIVEAVTGQDGSFLISGLAAGAYDITVEGYIEAAPDSITLDQGQTLSGLEIQVPYGGGVEGTIYDYPDRNPVQYAAVSAINESGDMVSTVSDENGAYFFHGIPAGVYSVSAESQGYTTVRHQGLQVSNGRMLREIDFLFRRESKIGGRVLDRESQIGVENAGLTAVSEDGLRFTARSGQDGAFIFERLAPGYYTVQCMAEGYLVSDAVRIDLTEDESPSYDFLLEKGIQATGRVVHEGEGVGDCLVFMRNLQTGLSDFVVTDADGAFDLLSLEPGLYYMNALAEGFSKGQALIDIQEDGAAGGVEINMAKSASLSGSILDLQGQAISGDAVLIVYGEDGRIVLSTIVEQGQFSMASLPVETLTIQTIHERYAYPQKTIQLTSNLSDVEIQPYPGALSGVIRSESAAPIVGATVTYIPAGSDTPNLDALVVASDESGRYQMEGVMPGAFLLTAVAEGHGRESQEGSLSGSHLDMDFSLSPPISISGQVIQQNSQSPIPYAMILIQSRPLDSGILVFANENGEFSDARLPAGTYIFTVYAENYPMHSENLAIAEEGEPIRLALDQEGMTLQGTIRDAQHLHPLPNAAVSITHNGFAVYSGNTDYQGRFQTPPLAPGEYQISMAFLGNAAQRELTIEEGSSLQIREFMLSLSPLAGSFLEEQAIASLKYLHKIAAQLEQQGEDGAERSALDPAGVTGVIFSNTEEYIEYVTELPNFPRSPLADEVLDYVGGDRQQWITLGNLAVDPLFGNPECPKAAYNVYHEYRKAESAYMRAWNQWVLNRSLATYAGTAESVAQVLVLAGHIADLGLMFTGKGAGILKELHDNVGHIGTAQSAYQLAQDAYNRITSSFNRLLEGKIGFNEFLQEVSKHLYELKRSENAIKVQAGIDPKFGAAVNPILKIKDIVKQIYDTGQSIYDTFQTISNVEKAAILSYGAYKIRMNRMYANYLKYRRKCAEDLEDFPEPPSTTVAQNEVTVVVPRDPNEKHGPGGMEGEITGVDRITYTIFFENMPTATASAQQVVIVDDLTDQLDWNSFQLQEAAFGERIIPIAGGPMEFYTQIALDEYAVDIEAKINTFTGRARWTLTMIDPETDSLPLDGGVGFLPPNDPDTGDGEGHVTFSIRPASDLESGTEIRNQAEIVFDANEPIATNQTVHTISPPAPDQPEAASPAPGALLPETQITLIGSAYSHPLGKNHRATQIEIRDYALGSIVWENSLQQAATEIAVPEGFLELERQYQWRIRYQSEDERWSSWSEYAWFQTTAQSQPGDMDGNGMVDRWDLLWLRDHWHQEGVNDLDGNNRIDFYDLFLFSLNWSAP
ncbi:MAG: carboxypeptidase regulatory-like domain-containing protein [Candidatus Omnitrophica bacterium]|nr:carboxypeptidase regulatory-like domain-containing protein [Candidatus Omnitrophota bacterium]